MACMTHWITNLSKGEVYLSSPKAICFESPASALFSYRSSLFFSVTALSFQPQLLPIPTYSECLELEGELLYLSTELKRWSLLVETAAKPLCGAKRKWQPCTSKHRAFMRFRATSGRNEGIASAGIFQRFAQFFRLSLVSGQVKWWEWELGFALGVWEGVRMWCSRWRECSREIDWESHSENTKTKDHGVRLSISEDYLEREGERADFEFLNQELEPDISTRRRSRRINHHGSENSSIGCRFLGADQ